MLVLRPSFATHHGPSRLAARPHGLTSWRVGTIGDERLLGEAVEAGAARRRRRGQRDDDDRERAELHVTLSLWARAAARVLSLAMKSRYQ